MSHKLTYNKAYYGPGHESLSLKVNDIIGAQPKHTFASKNIIHYQNKLSYDRNAIHERMLNQPLFNSRDVIFGGGYSKETTDSKVQKKHYNVHYVSEINNTDTMKAPGAENGVAKTFDYPRNLSTQDIPGAALGNDKRKFFKENEEQIRKSASVQRSRPQLPAAGRRIMDDSLGWLAQNQIERCSFEPRLNVDTHEANNMGNGVMNNNENSYTERLINPRMSVDNMMMRPSRVFPEEQMRPPNTERYSDQRVSVSNLRGAKLDSLYEAHKKYIPEEIMRSSRTGNKSFALNRSESQPQLESRGYNNNNTTFDNLRRVGMEPLPPVEKSVDRKKELKKVFTYNIIANQPISKMLPSMARLPYKYAIPFELDASNQMVRQNENDIRSAM